VGLFDAERDIVPHGMRSATTAHRQPFVDLLVVQLLHKLAEECEELVDAQVAVLNAATSAPALCALQLELATSAPCCGRSC
jgi:hypothetical protein